MTAIRFQRDADGIARIKSALDAAGIVSPGRYL